MSYGKLIQTITLGSQAASISFTSIPATYTDLMLVYSFAPSNGNNSASLLFNGSSASFTNRNLYGTGTSTASTSRTDNVFGAIAGLSTTTFSSGQIYVPNYASATNKSFSIDTVTENNGDVSFQWLSAGLWANTAAITSLTLTAPNFFTQYSSASLYGILKGSGGATVS